MEPYHRLARASGRYRWWRPLLELLMFCLLGLLALLVVAGPLLAQLGDSNAGAAGLIKLASVLAIGLPVTLLAARIAGRPPGATGRGDVWVTELNAHITWTSTAIDVASNVIYGVIVVRLHARFMAR